MRFPSNLLAHIGICLLLASGSPVKAQSVTRPVTGRGAEAKTLVVYADTHATYSLSDDLAALKLQLRRVASQLEVVPVAQADAAKFSAADYVVIFCPQPFPVLSAELLQSVSQSTHPVLWVGYGLDQLARLPEFKTQFSVAPFASNQKPLAINYKGREWQVPVPVWLPVIIDPLNTKANIIASLTVSNATEIVMRPLCWQTGQNTYIAGLPTMTATSPLFSDVLLDFFGATGTQVAAAAVRIDGYHCHQDHLEFRHLVDYLHERGHPFTVGVIPAYFDPETKKVQDLDSQPEFVAALRYAQRNGGRLILQGFANTRKAATGQEPEFWDVALDRPIADDSADYVLQRIQQGVWLMLKHGLFPVGWQTPFNSASRADYVEIGKHFSTSFERVQLSDTTGLEDFAPSAITMDDAGRLIIPENLGIVTGQKGAAAKIQSRAELLTKLRGTVSAFSFPAYLTDEKLKQVVSILEKTKVPFLDIGNGDNWVQLSDVILLTGNASRHVTLTNARINWKAFDRNGDLVAEEAEAKPASGEREFKRRGKGEYEIFEISEAKP